MPRRPVLVIPISDFDFVSNFVLRFSDPVRLGSPEAERACAEGREYEPASVLPERIGAERIPVKAAFRWAVKMEFLSQAPLVEMAGGTESHGRAISPRGDEG